MTRAIPVQDAASLTEIRRIMPRGVKLALLNRTDPVDEWPAAVRDWMLRHHLAQPAQRGDRVLRMSKLGDRARRELHRAFNGRN